MQNLDNARFIGILDTTKRWAQKEKIVQGIAIYNTYHEELLKDLPSLKGKKVIFLPGLSVDQADENPRYLGVDYACERNRLTDEVLLGVMELQKEFGWDLWEDIVFLQVQPVILPHQATPECTLVHSLEDAIRRAEQRTGKMFGNSIKDPHSTEFRPGISQFTQSVIDTGVAQDTYCRTYLRRAQKYALTENAEDLEGENLENLRRLLGQDADLSKVTRADINRALSDDTAFNRQLYISAMACLAKTLELEELYCFMLLGRQELEIMKRVSMLTGIPVDAWGEKGAAKNVDMWSTLKEADYRAIKRLKGPLRYWYNHKLGRRAVSVGKPVVRQQMPGYDLPMPCPDLPCMRCPYAMQREEDNTRARMDKSYTRKVRNCTCDFANNRFTRQDVEEVAKAKYGKNLLVDPDRLYEELRFTNMKYQEEDCGIREANSLQIMMDDVMHQGWSICRIDEDFRLMELGDGFIAKIGHPGEFMTRSWSSFRGDSEVLRRLGRNGQAGKIEPLIVPCETPTHYSIRPSEFSSRCPISRLLAKVAESNLPEKIIPHKWGVSGTVRHKLSLMVPFTDYMGRGDVPIWEYTEREVWASFRNPLPDRGELKVIPFFGHADTFGKVQWPGRYIPFPWDYKRSPNEKTPYTIQEMLYLLGAERALGERFDEAIQVLVNRPHFASEGERKIPIFHYTYSDRQSFDLIAQKEWDPVKRSEFTVQGLQEIVVRSYKEQHQLISSRSAFLDARRLCCSPGNVCFNGKKPGTCGHPFNSQMCNLVAELVERGEDIREYLIDGVVI